MRNENEAYVYWFRHAKNVYINIIDLTLKRQSSSPSEQLNWGRGYL